MDIKLCQWRPRLGDIANNLARAINEIKTTRESIIVFPELFLCGYPATDELFLTDIKPVIANAIDTLKHASRGCSVLIIIGTPYFDGQHWRNAALAIHNGDIQHKHFKVCFW